MPADESIRLATPDPDWPARFELEREALEGAIGEWVDGGIHHVGSADVPGLEAKPIVDILAGVCDLDPARACFEPLARLDYLYAPYLPAEMHWFCKPDRPGARIICTSSRPTLRAIATSWAFVIASAPIPGSPPTTRR